MAGSSIFITYGLKSGGGAPFLRRTRNAFGQLQTRTRTGATSNQLQTRTRTCSYTDTPIQCNIVKGGSSGGGTACANRFRCEPSTRYEFNCGGEPYCWTGSTGGGGSCSAYHSYQFSSGGRVFSLSAYSGWYNTSSCSAFSGNCSSIFTLGIRIRQCRTASVCNFGSFTTFSNVTTCNATNPACSNGAVNRECQTVFSFREQDWSPFEEADECVTSSPTAAQGAVQVECIAN